MSICICVFYPRKGCFGRCELYFLPNCMCLQAAGQQRPQNLPIKHKPLRICPGPFGGCRPVERNRPMRRVHRLVSRRHRNTPRTLQKRYSLTPPVSPKPLTKPKPKLQVKCGSLRLLLSHGPTCSWSVCLWLALCVSGQALLRLIFLLFVLCIVLFDDAWHTIDR